LELQLGSKLSVRVTVITVRVRLWLGLDTGADARDVDFPGAGVRGVDVLHSTILRSLRRRNEMEQDETRLLVYEQTHYS